MGQSPSLEANRFSARQEIHRIVRIPKDSLPHSQVPGTCPLSWATSIHPTPWRCILVLSFHLCMGLPSGLFPSGSPNKNPVYTSTLPHTCPAHLILLSLISWTILGEEYRSLSSSLCNFLHSPVTLSLLDPNILLSTLFSNTLSLYSSLNVSNQVLHPHKTRNKIIILYT